MYLEEINKHYPNCPPISWLLRESFKSTWFRIHSLPESKRYPESDEEYEILLKRHNDLASNILGEGSDVLLFWYGDNMSGGIVGDKVSDYNSDDIETTIYAKEIIWNKQQFNNYIKCVANEECTSSVFYSKNSGNIYAPYDGGADALIRTPSQLKELKEKYTKWFSNEPSGM